MGALNSRRQPLYLIPPVIPAQARLGVMELAVQAASVYSRLDPLELWPFARSAGLTGVGHAYMQADSDGLRAGWSVGRCV